MNPSIVMLMTTYAKLDRYTPTLLEVMDKTWPEHPPVRVVTDGKADPDLGVLAFPGLDWVALLLAGLGGLKDAYPAATHVFVMLDDHCPLRRVEAGVVEEYFQAAIDDDLAALAFPTYPWPWAETSDEIYDDGLVRTWRKIDVQPLGDGKAAVVPRDFFRYFQVQPTLWDLSYLIGVCEQAVADGVGDAWAFECIDGRTARQHYVAAYDWPTVHHGFLAQGVINRHAVWYADKALIPGFRRQLVREAIGSNSEILLMLDSARRTLAGQLRHRLGLR